MKLNEDRFESIVRLRTLDVGFTNYIEAIKEVWDNENGTLEVKDHVLADKSSKSWVDNGGKAELWTAPVTRRVLYLDPKNSEINALVARAIMSNEVIQRRLKGSEDYIGLFIRPRHYSDTFTEGDMLNVYKNAYFSLYQSVVNTKGLGRTLDESLAIMDTTLDLIRHRYGMDLYHITARSVCVFIRLVLEDLKPDTAINQSFLDAEEGFILTNDQIDRINFLNARSGVLEYVDIDSDDYKGKRGKVSWVPLNYKPES